MEHFKTKDFNIPHIHVILRIENLDSFTSRLHMNHFKGVKN
jgi:hypothetical protein